jgi:hypothetical protein
VALLGLLGEHREAFRVTLATVTSRASSAAAEPALGEMCLLLASHARVRAAVAATASETTAAALHTALAYGEARMPLLAWERLRHAEWTAAAAGDVGSGPSVGWRSSMRIDHEEHTHFHAHTPQSTHADPSGADVNGELRGAPPELAESSQADLAAMVAKGERKEDTRGGLPLRERSTGAIRWWLEQRLAAACLAPYAAAANAARSCSSNGEVGTSSSGGEEQPWAAAGLELLDALVGTAAAAEWSSSRRELLVGQLWRWATLLWPDRSDVPEATATTVAVSTNPYSHS